jgi:transketolase
MRNIFCQELVRHCANPEFVFLTGDLGYGTLEPLQKAAGGRFINAGIAEQNMVSVAAGFARAGLKPWIFSIGPFIFARPLEQICNDVCFHDLPVMLVGNGGGYAYGITGPSHHSIEDYGILLSLPNMYVFVPAFREDIPPIIEKLMMFGHPAYLRLGWDEKIKGYEVESYAPWRRFVEGKGPVLLVVGPLAGGLIGAFKDMDNSRRPNVWVVSELPVDEKTIPSDFLGDLEKSGHLAVAEEHVAHGSVGEALCLCLAQKGLVPRRFNHFCAKGYPSGYYGSQKFHREECGLTAENIIKELAAD